MAWINDLLFRSFGIEVSFLHLLVIITLISVITMIPVSLNGLGVREASYVLFFQSIGVPEGIALSVSLLFFISCHDLKFNRWLILANGKEGDKP